MKISELARLSGAKTLCMGEDKEIASGYTCDLLSHVMSRGVADMAWITVQTHMNVIAVATLLDFACIVIPEGISVDEAIVEKAAEEGVCMLSTPMSAYEVVALLAQNGIAAARKE